MRLPIRPSQGGSHVGRGRRVIGTVLSGPYSGPMGAEYLTSPTSKVSNPLRAYFSKSRCVLQFIIIHRLTVYNFSLSNF